MTCIVGLEHDGKVTLAGDSAATGPGYPIQVRLDQKVFRNGDFVMGFTSSFRMGQVLRYAFKPPKQKPKQDTMKFLVVDFIDSIRELFIEKGVMNELADDDGKSGEQSGGNFLLGYKGTLYNIDDDFQVAQTRDGYDAVGCGTLSALGSMYSTKEIFDPMERLTLALDAATRYNVGVLPPYNFVTL